MRNLIGKLQKYTIKTQLLTVFSILGLITILILSLSNLGGNYYLGYTVSNTSSDNLESQITNSMTQSVKDNSELIKTKFQNAEAAVNRLAESTQLIFSNIYNFESGGENYHDSELDQISDAEIDIKYQEVISRSTSTYYYSSQVILTETVNQTIEKSGNIDQTFRSIKNENDNYVWLYITFSDGIFRNFPGALVDDSKSYNPVNEPWYTDALLQRGEITYSEPYFDITQGLVVSLTKAVYDTNGNVIGVIGLDFKTVVIQEKILDIKFLESGYSALMQRTDLTVIAHPLWNSETHPINQEIPVITDIEVNLNGETALSNEILVQITTDDQGVVEFKKNNQEFLLAFAQIILNQQTEFGYTLMITTLKEEVLAPVEEVNNVISELNGQNNIRIIISALLVMLILIITIFVLGSRITTKVSQISEIALEMIKSYYDYESKADHRIEDLIPEGNDEIDNLARSTAELLQYINENKKKGF